MRNPPFPVLPANPRTVLFVCTGNLCRSAFAEEAFKRILDREGLPLKVSSAGTQALPGRTPPPALLQLMTQRGWDLSGHRSQKITPELLREAGIIFVMGDHHRESVLDMAPETEEKIFLLSQFYSQPNILPHGTEIPDPIGREAFFYENVHEILESCCEQVVEELKAPESFALRNHPARIQPLWRRKLPAFFKPVHGGTN